MSITFIQLDEAQVGDICRSLKQKRFGLTNMSFRYSIVHNKEIFLIDTYGYPDMLPNEDSFYETYYQNVEDHIFYAYLRWLGPMIQNMSQNFKVNINASVPVNSDGTFDHHDVEMTISTSIFTKTKKRHAEYTIGKNFFEKVLPFYKYLKSVEFKSHKYELNQILFNMKLDGIGAHNIFSAPTYNKVILAQWLATLDTFIENARYEYKVHSILDIINGKMNSYKYKSSTSFHFTHELNNEKGTWRRTGDGRGGL